MGIDAGSKSAILLDATEMVDSSFNPLELGDESWTEAFLWKSRECEFLAHSDSGVLRGHLVVLRGASWGDVGDGSSRGLAALAR